MAATAKAQREARKVDDMLQMSPVRVVVDGREYLTSRQILCRDKESVLAEFVSRRDRLAKQGQGHHQSTFMMEFECKLLFCFCFIRDISRVLQVTRMMGRSHVL